MLKSGLLVTKNTKLAVKHLWQKHFCKNTEELLVVKIVDLLIEILSKLLI